MMARATWENMIWHVNASEFRWGLCHGDFHARNMLMNRERPDEVVFIDFEFSGMGALGMDLGVMLIMALAPAERRKHEHSLVRLYYDTLLETGKISKEEFTYE